MDTRTNPRRNAPMHLLPQAVASFVELITFRSSIPDRRPDLADPEDYTWSVATPQSISSPMPSSASCCSDCRTDTGRS
jgi:hypothetical protein